MNTAISEGKWEKVQEYQKNPDKLPDTNYWRKKVEPLFQQAAENTKKSLPQIKPVEAEEVEEGNRE